MTHKEKILAALKGEMPDGLPYVPRIDLWYNANSIAGTLPEKHKDRNRDDISRAEGWALYKMLPDMLDLRSPEDILHRAIGIHPTRHSVHRIEFSSDVEIRVAEKGEETRVEYFTPKGMVSTVMTFPEELRRSGSTYPVIIEHAIKDRGDYAVLAYIFENLKVIPYYNDFLEWEEETGENGFCCAAATFGASPMHHIQRDFLDPTSFFLHYKDCPNEMRGLTESIEIYYRQLLSVVAESPATGVNWGGNYDDMITYPPFFEKEILPWLHKAGDTLRAAGKIIVCHCDGENFGLMDLIKDSRINVAEAICPYPMTKVTINEYYEQWCENITIFGGIPSSILSEMLYSNEEFESYLDHFFKAIVPGRRFVVGIADTTPPDAVFDRLIRIGERVEKEGRLPLTAGGINPVSREKLAETARRFVPPDEISIVDDTLSGSDEKYPDAFKAVHRDVLSGNDNQIKENIQLLLEKGYSAKDILNQGLIMAMDVIGSRFKNGTVFIPEVLLSARAMNEAIIVLEPYFSTEDKEQKAKILVGTVKGDLHDIGKNMVLTMMKGSGFDTVDMGINVPVEHFVEQVKIQKPEILGLSALLTTTMPQMGAIIDALVEAKLRSTVKILVGGAPVNERYARGIGADGYAPDAVAAVALAKRLIDSE